jgi:lipoprotein NlpI
MGVAWEQKGDAPQAQQNLEAALALQPDYPPAFNDLGLILWQEGNRNGAMEE